MNSRTSGILQALQRTLRNKNQAASLLNLKPDDAGGEVETQGALGSRVDEIELPQQDCAIAARNDVVLVIASRRRSNLIERAGSTPFFLLIPRDSMNERMKYLRILLRLAPPMRDFKSS